MADPTPPPAPTSSSSPPDPTEEQQQREALAAFTATLHSVGTNLEAPLRDRASTIQSNAAALQKQETELAESTARLARQNAQWTGLADETREGLKEIGDVQNWAEVIERDLLVLEDMMDSVEAKERETRRVDAMEENGDRNGDVNGKQDDGKKGGWLRWW
ncbi:hypothetical protein N7492_006021 [Penicillium capsulatum]|uniref:Biogenesis of lysosome-related organelles complex 1 subunit 1 n=1 Tax=Penicillium capsulatum TaxID=69766 RepID=A0A9W9ICY6_9EURO|nr:hypothetical protein N7492_006021 [Penicillium capsulatum]KAJ6134875.1 hypothetical protein N7512_000035 [Penicillium capsulatum]